MPAGPGTFDYVIIGAGSAGCVLANRLTEQPDVTVLLLEAGGPDRRFQIHVPAAYGQLFKSSCDWAFVTEPQAELKQRKLYWPRGKMLGGTSSMNAMIYIRGSRHDYEGWHAAGNEGWGFADVLPYFKRAENQQRGASDYHGVGGPLSVADARSLNPLSRVFLAAGAEAGYPRNDDFNGPEQDGVGLFQLTQRDGKRCSAAVAYLRPALNRPNLTVLTRAQVTRLTFSGRRVTGVEYRHNDQMQQTAVAREAILSGGAVNSPQLLMLSGVGPAAHLRSLGIAVVADLPGVGQNLQDHMILPVCYRCSQKITLDTAKSPGNLLRFLLFRRGPYTSNVGEAGGFFRTTSGIAAPDMQIFFAPAYSIHHGFTVPGDSGYSISPSLLGPRSRGAITLRSADPFAPPVIQPNYLSDENDMRVLVEGTRIARQIGEAAAFRPFRKSEYCPGVEVESDEAIRKFIRSEVETSYHPVGTCKMGRDSMAVVDTSLRVRGVDGLRVIDASIMPLMIMGNTNAPTIMIAEKGADLIKG